jgi:hypothetical protein
VTERRTCSTAGLEVAVCSDLPWVGRLLEEAAAGELAANDRPADIEVHVERSDAPFPAPGAEVVTRGAVRTGGQLVVEDACASGFDLSVRPQGDRLTVRARWRPSSRDRAASALLRSRFHLLARSALLQYPALWWAGVRGAAPLHASAIEVDGCVLLLAGAGGVGKSTLLATELALGAVATSDNLCTSDGETVAGLLEPLRTETGSGRRMPHGRRERAWPRRAAVLRPHRVVVVRRGTGAVAATAQVDPAAAARVLVAGTYAAGELRRYWAFAATLALGTGLGPAHPAVDGVAARLVAALPCDELVLPGRPGTRLRDVVATASWAV